MRRIVVMGASGCGKSSIGRALAQAIAARFVDGDDLHPARNVEKMRQGTPLDDDDRAPWLAKVGAALAVGNRVVGAVAVAAYSYMSLVPLIQPPIIKLLTSKADRAIRMEQLRPVSKMERILFPIVATVGAGLLLPAAVPLIGTLMFGNLLRVCGCTERLSQAAQNEILNTTTIFLGLSVGATMSAKDFLTPATLKIVLLGLIAFVFSTAGGVLFGQLMKVMSKGKINPMIGSAGVSAVPMAARVVQRVCQQENPGSYLLMHAMGPNVAGVIGTAVAAGVMLTLLS